MPILVEAGVDRLSSADLAVVVCWDDIDTRPPESVLAALRAVADRGGGLAPMMLRRHFSRRWGVTPQAYRQRFSQLAV